jgi:hypothetical protein
MNAPAGAHDDAVQMIDTSIVRVHQHGGVPCASRRSAWRARTREREPMPNDLVEHSKREKRTSLTTTWYSDARHGDSSYFLSPWRART